MEGAPTPVKLAQPTSGYPPCHRCPKLLLFPNYQRTVGLHPKNEAIVDLYRLAAEDIRAGDCGALTGTLTIESISCVLDEYPEKFPTRHARQQAIQLLWILGKVATAKRAEREDKARKKEMDKIKNDGKGGKSNRISRNRR